MESTHPSLLERLRDFADHAAWREFDERYRALILRYCFRRGLQAADAEDIRQIAVLSFARHLERFVYRRELGRFRDYLGRIVRNAIHHHATRHTGRCERPLPDALDPAAAVEQDSLWEEEWRLHHYRTAMQTIRATFQPANLQIFDALLAGRSIEDLMQTFGTTRDAIYKVRQRVRDRLRDLVAEQVREEDLPAAPADSPPIGPDQPGRKD